MSDLLKEAIADAKAVRETALANAKMALEEAFTPQLKSMLSAKLKEDEFEDEEEFGGEEEIPALEPEVEEGIIEINGVKYAPIVSEDEHEGGGEEELGIEDDGNLDLEAIIRELEDEINEEDDAYDEKQGKTDASHLAEEDDAYDENAENNKNPESGDGNKMDGVAALKSEGEEGDDEDVEIDESIFAEGEDDDDEDDDEVDEGKLPPALQKAIDAKKKGKGKVFCGDEIDRKLVRDFVLISYRQEARGLADD